MSDLIQWFKTISQWAKSNPIAAVTAAVSIAGVILTALLNRFFPFLWAGLVKGWNWLKLLVKGQWASHTFEKKYLNWLVSELRELRLTGVASYDDTKKPRVEDVYVALEVAGRHELMLQSAEAVAKALEDLQTQLPLAATDSSVISRLLDQMRAALRSTLRPEEQLTELAADLARELEGLRVDTAPVNQFRAQLAATPAAPAASAQDEEAPDAGLAAILNSERRIAILGAPGAGKTTLLQYIGLTYGRHKAGDAKLRVRDVLKRRLHTGKWRVPVFVSLSSLAARLEQKTDGRRPTLAEILPKLLPAELQTLTGASEYFARQLEEGNCILLFDGLDEVPGDAEFETVVAALEEAAIRYDENQFIVTSRIAGWRSGIGADFQIYYVKDLTKKQVGTFIDSWYEAVERNAVVGRLEDEAESDRLRRTKKAKQRADALKRALEDNPPIRSLAANPMLLSIIALVHRSLATLPKERSKLYAECNRILLDLWDVARGVRVSDTNLTLEQKQTIMRRLAWALHTGEIGRKGGGREAPREEVEQVVAGILPKLGAKKEDAPLLLKWLIERSGLVAERRRNVLAFAHHTLQEFCAAGYLARRDPIEQERFWSEPGRLLSDWWREVALLYAGLLEDSSDFVSMILNSGPEDLCCLRLRLAALCLGEAVAIKKPDLRNRIADKLLSIRVLGGLLAFDGAASREVSEYLIRWAGRDGWYGNAAEFAARSALDEAALRNVERLCWEAASDQSRLVRLASLRALRLVSTAAVDPAWFGLLANFAESDDGELAVLALAVLKEHLEAFPNHRNALVALVSEALSSRHSSVQIAGMETLEACLVRYANVEIDLGPLFRSVISLNFEMGYAAQKCAATLVSRPLNTKALTALISTFGVSAPNYLIKRLFEIAQSATAQSVRERDLIPFMWDRLIAGNEPAATVLAHYASLGFADEVGDLFTNGAGNLSDGQLVQLLVETKIMKFCKGHPGLRARLSEMAAPKNGLRSLVALFALAPDSAGHSEAAIQESDRLVRSHASPDVRLRAVQILMRLGRLGHQDRVINLVMPMMRRVPEALRVEMLDESGDLLTAQTAPRVIKTIEELVRGEVSSRRRPWRANKISAEASQSSRAAISLLENAIFPGSALPALKVLQYCYQSDLRRVHALNSAAEVWKKTGSKEGTEEVLSMVVREFDRAAHRGEWEEYSSLYTWRLSNLPLPSLIPVLLKALDCPVAQVRRQALGLLRVFRPSDFPDELIEAIKFAIDDGGAEVRLAFLSAFQSWHTSKLGALFLSLLNDASESVADQAFDRALLNLRGQGRIREVARTRGAGSL